jgi:glutamate synthase (NADPH/NADH) large chain
MTGGTVVCLGETGRNFAAGMSGGVAYVLDETGLFRKRCNSSMVMLEPVVPEIEQSRSEPRHLDRADEAILREMIERHYRYTDSATAKRLLDDWKSALAKFVKVVPNEYRRALGELSGKRQRAKQLEAA